MKRVMAFLLCALMCFGLFNVSAQNGEVSQNALPLGYQSVANGENIQLFADMKTGDFAVLEKNSNRIWYSGQHEVLDAENPISSLNFGRIKTELVSMLAINYVQVSTIASTAVPLYQNSYAYCVNEGGVTAKTINNGYRADYYFADLDATVPVEITLKGDTLKAEILGDQLKMGKDYRIISISLLPGFLAGDERREGYLFVPSGSGGLINFATARGENATYSEMVYGDDVAIEQEEYEGEKIDISVPVYGIKSGETAVSAVITAGDSSARITAEADSLSSSFTRVFSEYITSIIDSTTLFESNYENQRIIYGAENRDKYIDYSVEYTFLFGNEADYSGMAKVYRDYLNLSPRAEKPSLRVTLYGAAEKKASFLGIPYNKTVSLTSFSQAQQIAEELKEKVEDVSLIYKGWSNSGINNKKSASKVSPVRVLGGASGLKKLDKFLKNEQIDAYLDVDLMLIKKSGNGFSLYSDVCKSIFNTRTPIYDYMRSVYVPVNNRDPYYLLTPDNVKKAADKFLKGYKYDTGISFAGLSNSLYSDFKNGKEREDCMKTSQKVLEKAQKNSKIALSAPNAYALKYADSVYDIPMSHDGNLLFDKSVPFLQMVLHGSVSYSASNSASILDCIEYGADPAYYGIYIDANELFETDYNWLFGTTYDNWKDEAVEAFKEYKAVYSQLYDKKIVSHSSENGISKTVFEDSTVVLVNRTESSAEVNGVSVEPNGFAVIGGAANEKN